MNPENRSILPGVAIAGFFSRYREPTTKEGFEEITKVDFRVCMGVWVFDREQS